VPTTQTTTIDKMNNFRFQTITLLSVVIFLVTIINHGHSASVSDKDDSFTINVTMKNFKTTHVCISNKKYSFGT
jgi:hypothetical protein